MDAEDKAWLERIEETLYEHTALLRRFERALISLGAMSKFQDIRAEMEREKAAVRADLERTG